ncbi:hypothetical protein [Henriciella sp.]|jgi:hypothetical protein|uniref:hypothetical protein n=1 Tax=Henriciella sp. TaxID=1968823 RepID=UPI000C103E97|nr:hypothetical protein [Henriciella sp.]PHR79535.1 MAG: hypothetical protein COA64_05750 [Henriciella sp.]|tara:strand:- start:590 stop:1018 length:429 start_codon:yes stop_codon:yes gene_type:complete
MSLSTDAAIRRITDGLIARSLPKAEWTHEAHFGAALDLLSRPDIDAFAEMPAMIRAYNAAVGTPNSDTEGYHETITFASLRAARAHLKTCAGAPLPEVLALLMASECGRNAWLTTYWSRERLFSPEARKGWVEPDLKPLPYP